jgi:hypothetical protein
MLSRRTLALWWRAACRPGYVEAQFERTGRQLIMFGRVGYRIDRNVAVCLAVVAAMLLLAGLALAVTAPAAHAQLAPAPATGQAPHHSRAVQTAP